MSNTNENEELDVQTPFPNYPQHPAERPKKWTNADPMIYAPPQKDEPWNDCLKSLRKYDKDMCNGWTNDISNMLTFAGLFSAVVTTFLVESYEWLDEDPDDKTHRLLSQLIAQGSPNDVPDTPSLQDDDFTPARSIVYVNVLWFLSLTLSLSAALLGIISSQWIREYRRDAAVSSREAVAIRQMRFDGLQAWHVPSTIASLPVLIQSAVLIFFVGMIQLLWGQHSAVAIPCTVVAGMTTVFTLLTTILPSTSLVRLRDPPRGDPPQPPCPYKSLQSWMFYRSVFVPLQNLVLHVVSSDTLFTLGDCLHNFGHWVTTCVHHVKRATLTVWSPLPSKGAFKKSTPNDWLSLERQAHMADGDTKMHFTRNALLWIRDNLGDSFHTRFAIVRCLISLQSEDLVRWILDSAAHCEDLRAPVFFLYHELLLETAERVFRAEMLVRVVHDPASDRYRPRGAHKFSDRDYKSTTAYALFMLDGLLYSVRENRDILYQLVLSLEALFRRCPGPRSIADHLQHANIANIMFTLLECPFEDVRSDAGASLTHRLLSLYIYTTDTNERGSFLFRVAQHLEAFYGKIRPGVTRASLNFIMEIDDAITEEQIETERLPMSRHTWNTSVRKACLNTANSVFGEKREILQARLVHSDGHGPVVSTSSNHIIVP